MSLPGLPARVEEVARYVREGLNNPEISVRMTISVKSVENYMNHLYRFFDISVETGGNRRVKLVLRLQHDREKHND